MILLVFTGKWENLESFASFERFNVSQIALMEDGKTISRSFSLAHTLITAFDFNRQIRFTAPSAPKTSPFPIRAAAGTHSPRIQSTPEQFSFHSTRLLVASDACKPS